MIAHLMMILLFTAAAPNPPKSPETTNPGGTREETSAPSAPRPEVSAPSHAATSAVGTPPASAPITGSATPLSVAPQSTHPLNCTEKPARPDSSSSDSRRLKLLFFSDLHGNFSSAECGPKPVEHRSLLHLKQLIRTTRVLDLEQGRVKPIVVGGGSVIGPADFSHFLFSKRRYATWGTKFMEGMGLDVLSLGPTDLTAPTANLVNYLRSGHGLRFPFLGTNLVCKKGNDIRCQKYIKPYVIVERKGIRLAFVALFRPDQLALTTTGIQKWLTVEPPEKAWAKYHAILKKKVHGIVLVSHLDRPATYPAANFSFLRRIKDAEPLFVLASGSSNPIFRHKNNVPYIHRGGNAPIIGSERYAMSMTFVELPFTRVGTRWALNRAGIIITEKVPRLGWLDLRELHTLRSMKRVWCEHKGRHLGEALFKVPMKEADFVTYALRAARIHAKAEIGVLNRSLVWGMGFPLKGKVTEEKIAQALRSNSPLVIITLTGEKLKALLGTFSADAFSDLALEGLVKKKETWYINSRALQDDQHYRIVTTKYVATGGGGYFPSSTKYEQLGLGVRSFLIKWFGEGGASRFDDDHDVSVEKDFPDLWETFILIGGANLGFTGGITSLSNPALYEGRSQLDREELKKLNLDLTLWGGLGNRKHAITARSRLLFGKSWTFSTDEESGDRMKINEESADEVQFTLTYQSKTIRNVWTKQRWWAPVPFLEAGLKTEFTPGLRDDTYRYKLFTGIGGIGWELWENRMFVKLGIGERREYGEDGPQAQQTLYAGYQFTNGELFKIRDITIKGESRLDGYYYRVPAGANHYEVEWTTKIYVTLTDRFFLNFTYAAYAYREAGARWSWASELLLGVTVLFDRRVPFVF